MKNPSSRSRVGRDAGLVHKGAAVRREEVVVARFIPIVGNPHVEDSHIAIERLSAALTMLGGQSLILDAADSSPQASDAVILDLASGIERLTPHVSYLAGRDLPMRYVDTHGSAARLLDELASQAGNARVILVHAEASDLARLFTGRSARPVLLAADQPESLKHAYAAWKHLVQRRGWLSGDLLLVTSAGRPRCTAIASSLGRCADSFMGAVLTDWASVHPGSAPTESPDAAITRLARGQLRIEEADRQLILPQASPARDGSAVPFASH